jgi:DNA polymerase
VPTLYRDYETRSTSNLKRVGSWKYAVDSATDVWCCAYAVDDGPVALWIPGDPVPPEFIEAANSPDWIVSAFNDTFERHVEMHIMAPRYGWPIIPLEQHRCTQAAALALALPASLKAVAVALGIEEQKDEAGQRLMKQMARPRKPKRSEDQTGVYWFDDPERLNRLYEYCRQDVETERAIYKRIGHLPENEQGVWVADAIINDRGIRIDRKLARGAMKIGTDAQHAIDAELRATTAGAVETVGQVARLLEWLAANAVELKDVQKETVRQALTRKEMPSAARRVLELRYSGARIAGAKFETMLNWAGVDDRIRGAFKYHGAATGRWASYGVQLQNLKKPNGLDIAAAIDLVTSGNLAALQQQCGDPLGVVGELTRAAICAAPGHRLIAADFSGVESRVTAWLAGEQSKIGLWAKFDKTGAAEDEPYYVLGKQFGFAEDCARAKGKTADLAFGYNGGEGAYRKFAGDEASAEEIGRLKRAWRDAHPNVVKLWTQLDRLAKRAVANPNQMKHVNRHVAFCFDGTFLRMRLPSRRCIAYPFPRLEKNERGDSVVIFKDNAAGKFVDCRHGQGAWPGLWIENAVQAVARDLFVAAMQRLESAGYSITMHVHDEILAEVPDGFGSDENFLRILTEAPAWAAGLPIAAKVCNGPRFCRFKPQAADGGDAGDGRDDDEASDDSPLDSEPDDDAGGDDSSPASESPKSDDETSTSPSRDWKRYQSGEREWGEDVAEYVYRDQRGQPYLKVKRTSNKQFPQFHYVETASGSRVRRQGQKFPTDCPSSCRRRRIRQYLSARVKRMPLTLPRSG